MNGLSIQRAARVASSPLTIVLSDTVYQIQTILAYFGHKQSVDRGRWQRKENAPKV